MTSPERLVELEAMHKEFEADETTRERRIEILTTVRDFATEEMPAATFQCVQCKKTIFFCPWYEALIEGHIYSRDGMKEFGITKLCEFCFDEITKEPDEEESDGQD